MFFIYFLTICVALLIWFYIKFLEVCKSSEHIPGPKPLPIIGNALMFFGKDSVEIREVVEAMKNDFGLFFRFLLGSKLLVHLVDPKDVEALLVDQKILDKSEEYDITQPWIGTGILTAPRDKWPSRRKVTTPGFHFRCLQEFVKVFDKNSEILVEKLKQKTGEIFDIQPYTQLCALDNICETALGTSINAQSNSENDYEKAIEEITNLFSKRFAQLPLRSDFIFKWTPYYKKQQKLLEILHGFTNRVIEARREELEKQIIEGKEIESKALIDVLLTSTIDGKPLSNEDIREEIDTFSFAGHDTTAIALAFCLYNLAKNPDVQQKAYEEVQSLFGDSDKEITMSDLNDLNYLDLVIKESLRMFPPVPMIGRKLLEDLSLNGKFIPKGATMIISSFAMGRSEKLWENWNEFIPERFEPQNMTEKSSCHWVAFGAGPRNCIGQKFAMLEIKSVLSNVLKNFQLHADDFKPIVSPEIVLKSANGIKLRVKTRM